MSSIHSIRELSFNPRTHVGCDSRPTACYVAIFCFNPRTHVGCDLSFRSFGCASSMFQSTHPRRVRLLKVSCPWLRGGFNPRTHVGCDKKELDAAMRKRMFQSTHPRRVRREADAGDYLTKGFNPRTHVGCDKALVWPLIRMKSFNPRTHVGCDVATAHAYPRNEVSIHAPT